MAALQNTVLCTDLNTECVNTIGSFECVCVDGYELVDEECQRKIDYSKFYPYNNEISLGIVNEMVEPPQVVVPMLGQENVITFVVETYHLSQVKIGSMTSCIIYLTLNF